MNQYFQLFSYCIPVKGYKKAVICDLQRNIIQPIPLSLYELLASDNQSNIGTFESTFDNFCEKDKQLIQEYITFLYNNQFGYTSEKPMKPVLLDLGTYEECRCITNAIVDFDEKSNYRLSLLLPQLNELNCLALHIRYFYPVTLRRLELDLLSIRQSTLKVLEIFVVYSDAFKLERVLKIQETYPIIKKFIVSKSHENTVYNRDDLSIIYTTEDVVDEKSCGVTDEFYCIAETKLFIESIHFNSCLNKKISVDKYGQIKNCPSMKKSFGHVSTTKLQDVVQDDSFRKVWKINKDRIEVCSDCELRYVCQDCRAYIQDTNNIYSKPLKCKYNPYE